MSYSLFTASTFAARTFEPSTVDEANAAAVLRVLRWFAVAAAVALALSIAAAWLALQLGLAAYSATERFDSFAAAGEVAQAGEPSIEQLAQWSESLPIEWPAGEAIAAEPGADISEMTVSELRREAQSRGVSIRRDGRVLRRAELIAAMA